jgi:hypothetical protein
MQSLVNAGLATPQKEIDRSKLKSKKQQPKSPTPHEQAKGMALAQNQQVEDLKSEQAFNDAVQSSTVNRNLDNFYKLPSQDPQSALNTLLRPSAPAQPSTLGTFFPALPPVLSGEAMARASNPPSVVMPDTGALPGYYPRPKKITFPPNYMGLQYDLRSYTPSPQLWRDYIDAKNAKDAAAIKAVHQAMVQEINEAAMQSGQVPKAYNAYNKMNAGAIQKPQAKPAEQPWLTEAVPGYTDPYGVVKPFGTRDEVNQLTYQNIREKEQKAGRGMGPQKFLADAMRDYGFPEEIAAGVENPGKQTGKTLRRLGAPEWMAESADSIVGSMNWLGTSAYQGFQRFGETLQTEAEAAAAKAPGSLVAQFLAGMVADTGRIMANPIATVVSTAGNIYSPDSTEEERMGAIGNTALLGVAIAPGVGGAAATFKALKNGTSIAEALIRGGTVYARDVVPLYEFFEKKASLDTLVRLADAGGAFDNPTNLYSGRPITREAAIKNFKDELKGAAENYARIRKKHTNDAFKDIVDEWYELTQKWVLNKINPANVDIPGAVTAGAQRGAGGYQQFQPAISGPARMSTRAGELAIPETERYQNLIPGTDEFVAYKTGDETFKRLVKNGMSSADARIVADKVVDTMNNGTYIPEYVEGGANFGPDGTRFDSQQEYYAYYMAHNAWRALKQIGATDQVATNTAVLMSKLFKLFADQGNELYTLRTIGPEILNRLAKDGQIPDNALPQLEKIITEGLEGATGQIPGAVVKTGAENEDELLLAVAKQVQKAAQENPIFPKGTKVSNLPDEQIIEGIRQATIKEVEAWKKSRDKMQKKYSSFYKDDVLKANKLLQDYAKKTYGRELTDNEIDFYHLVSGFASPSNAPVNDSNAGFQIFDRWMKSGQKDFSVYGHNYKTIWEQIYTKKGWNKMQTDFAALGPSGELQPTKFTPAYYAGGMDRVQRLIENLGFDNAMEFLRTKHSFEDITKAFKLTPEEIKKLKQHEYLTKKDGGFGIFGIGDAPKLGSYVLNRWQLFGTITKDMWVARTMARMTGDPLIVSGEVIKEPWKLTKEGVRMRKLLDEAWTQAGIELGMDPAMVQEAMWDVEQVIYNAFGNPRTASYVSEGLQNGIDVVRGVTPAESNKAALLENIATPPPARAYIEARPGKVGWEKGGTPALKGAPDKVQEALIDEVLATVFKKNQNAFVNKLVKLIPGKKNVKAPTVKKSWGYYEGRWSPNIEIQFANAEDGRLATAVLGTLMQQDAVPLSALSPYKKGIDARIIKVNPDLINTEAERKRIGKILAEGKNADGKVAKLGASFDSEGNLIILNISKAANFDEVALKIAKGEEKAVRSFMSEVGEYYDKRLHYKYNPETGKGFATGTYEEILKAAQKGGGIVDPVTGKPVRKKLFEQKLVEPLRQAYRKVQQEYKLDPATIDAKIVSDAERIIDRLKLKQTGEGLVRGFYDLKGKTITLIKGRANVDTLIHEVGHHLKEVLLGMEEHGPIVRRLYGGTDDIAGHERFADHLVAYFREGRIPAKGLQGVFESVKTWLRNTAKTYGWNEIDPEFKAILDKIYGDEDAVTKALMSDLDKLGKKANDTTTTTKATGAIPGGVRGETRVLPADIRGGATAAEAARDADGSLKGLPRQVAGVTYAHHAPAENVAKRYMENKGLAYNPPSTYAKVDPERARKIADAYAAMKNDPTDPEVRRAYDAMAKETLDQYKEIEKEGIKFEFFDPAKGDPYAGNPNNVFDDVKRNKHMWVFPTSEGYGTTGFSAEDVLNNPLLADSGIKWNGQPTTVNDIFRAVHDYFGHIKEGVGFRANGEENAWRAHSAMYSDEARKAMTSETRGQNSWVNFGPESGLNRGANQLETVYADQKVGLLPDWAINEGRMDDMVPTSIPGPAKPVVSGQVLAQTEKTPDLIATANQITADVRRSVGLDDVNKVSPEQIADWEEEARKINTEKLMDEMLVSDKFRPLTKSEELAMGARLSRALERYDAAQKIIEDADFVTTDMLDRAQSAREEILKISDFTNAVGTEWGRAGVARQALIRADYTTAGVISKIKKAESAASKAGTKEVRASAQQIADAEEFAKQAREKDAKIAELEKKIEDLRAQGAKEAPKRRIEARRKRLEAEADDILAQIFQTRNRPSPGIKQGPEKGAVAIDVEKNVELMNLYGKLAKNFIQRGALNIEDVYVSVSEIAKQAGHAITKQGLIDALDQQAVKTRTRQVRGATKAEILQRQELNRQIAKGSTRGQEAAAKAVAEKEVIRKAREEALALKKAENEAKRQAIRAEKQAANAQAKSEADAYRAKAKAQREEARRLAAEQRKLERQAKIDARQARRNELNQALGPIARDERKIANLKGRIEDYNRMIETGEFFASRPLKEGDEGYELTHLQEQVDLLRYEAKMAKMNVDGIIDDISQPKWVKIMKEVVGLPRYFQLGLDAGALTRQGFDIALVSPKAWTKAAKAGFGAAISNPAKVAKMEEEFMRSPEVLKAIANGLAIDGPSEFPEGFVSKLAAKVPGYGRGERFHKTFQNFARFEAYKNLTRNQNLNQYQLKEVAKLINAMTGRGSWKGAEGPLASIFTAPKMYAGQLEVMGKTAIAVVDPRFRTNPAYRKLIVRRWLGRMGGLVALKGLADATDWEFSINPDDSDFLKLRNGDVVIDVTGGYSAWYKLLFGTLNMLADTGMNPSLEKDLIRSLGYKVSPTVRGPISLFTGKDAIGNPFFVNPDTGEREVNVKDLAKTFAPLIGVQLYEMAGGDEGYQNMDLGAKVGLGALGFVGTGVSKYPARESRRPVEETKWGQLLDQIGVQPR